MSAHILFVDDEPQFLAGLRRMLRPHHHEEWTMTFVESVAEAVQDLSEVNVDLVVVDLHMPHQTGFDLLQWMTESPRLCHIPIIVMTGAAERALKRRVLDRGATDLLNKPVDPAELIARIRSAVLLKSYQDQIRRHNDLLEHRVRERTKDLDASRLDLIWRLGRVAEFRDEQTGNHIMRVGSYCMVLAETLGMPKEFCEMIYLASPLHDIGKIGIPDGVLLQPRQLTAAEWDIIKRHCRIGAEILQQDAWSQSVTGTVSYHNTSDAHGRLGNPFLEMAASIALAHHEWWSGSGYPRRLSGEAIPLEARIVAVADVYDALSSVRPYKPAFPEDQVLTIMREKVGSHFDPAVYHAFSRSLPACREILGRWTDEKATAA